MAIRFPRPPWLPPLGELAAKPTERVKIALSASGTSPKGRDKALIRHGYAVTPTHHCAITTGNHQYSRSTTLGQQGGPLRSAVSS